ncbi:hypothetical protein FB451DRAFT_1398091 [Mycena latifolia]|nr:hypothetical protein FB451DRAFT_1398091 [Mycena latifolia]
MPGDFPASRESGTASVEELKIHNSDFDIPEAVRDARWLTVVDHRVLRVLNIAQRQSTVLFMAASISTPAIYKLWPHGCSLSGAIIRPLHHWSYASRTPPRPDLQTILTTGDLVLPPHLEVLFLAFTHVQLPEAAALGIRSLADCQYLRARMSTTPALPAYVFSAHGATTALESQWRDATRGHS